MALPIRAKDTQEGCNPISSNCVIWQGPDIPCIDLCKGDSVSDVTAKAAEKLCLLLDQTNVSTYDISCFNPLCPNPKDFHDLIQILIDRICALYDLPVTSGGSAGCPDCVVPIAQCLQRPDALGNITTTLQLKDYVILIGNEICSSLTSITSIQTQIDDLNTRVTDIETNCCSGGGSGTDIIVPTSKCLNLSNTPIVDYVTILESAFCDAQAASGTQSDINTALTYKCISGNDSTVGASGIYSNLPGWVESPTSLAQAVQDLWLVVCDQYNAIKGLGTTIEDLQLQLSQCCGAAVACSTAKYIATAWYEIAAPPLAPGYFVIGFDPVLSNIPAGYSICQDTPATITIFPSNVSAPLTPFTIQPGNDFDEIHYPGPFRTIPMSGAYANVPNALYASITIDMCITNGEDTCTVSTLITNIQLEGSAETVLKASLTSGGTAESPTVKATLYPDGYPNVYTGGTTWVMKLRLGDNSGPIVASTTVTTASQGSKIEYTFNDDILLPGQSYGMTVDIIQGSFSKLNIESLNNAVTPATPTPAP